MADLTPTRCNWSDGAPAGLCDEAEGWGIDKLEEVFVRAHRGFKSHDDGNGFCKVCGAALDFEGWLDEQERPVRTPPQ